MRCQSSHQYSVGILWMCQYFTQNAKMLLLHKFLAGVTTCVYSVNQNLKWAGGIKTYSTNENSVVILLRCFIYSTLQRLLQMWSIKGQGKEVPVKCTLLLLSNVVRVGYNSSNAINGLIGSIKQHCRRQHLQTTTRHCPDPMQPLLQWNKDNAWTNLEYLSLEEEISHRPQSVFISSHSTFTAPPTWSRSNASHFTHIPQTSYSHPSYCRTDSSSSPPPVQSVRGVWWWTQHTVHYWHTNCRCVQT